MVLYANNLKGDLDMEDRQCSNSECTKESCAGCEQNKGSMLEPLNSESKVDKVIAVMSGKGGVGKSLVTASLAVAFFSALKQIRQAFMLIYVF